MASVTNIGKYCGRCDEELETKDECFDCDSCMARYHLNCCGVSKSELKARKTSTCLRLYCTSCFSLFTSGVVSKVDELLKFVHKIDLFNQETKSTKDNDAAVIQSIMTKINQMDEKVTSIESGMAKTTPTSFANVLKTGNVNPVVIVKPKKKQKCAETLNEINRNINKKDLNVCKTRNTRDGAVILSCESTNETMKAKQLINDKLGSEYEVVLPDVKNPRLRISNLDPEIENDNLINVLKSHNQRISAIEMKLITVINRKYRNHFTKDIVVEVKSDDYKQLRKIETLNLPWRECKIHEHLYIKRCFKCCGFAHIAKDCKQKQRCSKCAGNHKYSECKSNDICCINCRIANEKWKSKLNTNHHSWSKECSVIKRKMVQLQDKIEYNEAK